MFVCCHKAAVFSFSQSLNAAMQQLNVISSPVKTLHQTTVVGQLSYNISYTHHILYTNDPHAIFLSGNVQRVLFFIILMTESSGFTP